MDKPLFSEHWYRVKSLRPKLRPHTRLHRHVYRGDIWYLLSDAASARYHRFNLVAYQIIGLMDGRRTAHQIWETVNTRMGDAAPVQDDIIQLLGQLHQMDALQTNIAPDVEEIFQRAEQYEQQQWRGRLKNPLAVRVGLFDPDLFLNRTRHLVAPLFSRWFFSLWCLLVVVGAVLAGMHWETLMGTVRVEALSPNNLLLLWFTYPVVKLLHELAHAYAAKLQGGEVHEIGIMLLVFVPVPFVDASAATAFPQRHMRMLVGAAGIMVELLLAVLALFVWLLVEPGLISSLCFNIMLIGGVSTLLFNGNPLLRFDGYYVLADAVGIPNLAQRANKYLAYLAQRYVLGVTAAQSPATGAGEEGWFAFYGIAAFFYRLMITAVICLYLIDTFFVVGILLAAWSITNQLLLPLFKQVRFLLFDPLLHKGRPRALLVTAGALAFLSAVVMWFPVSSLTRFEGVIWPPQQSQLVAETDGFVQQLLAQPGSNVVAGQPLVGLVNVRHQGEMKAKQARLLELSAKYRAAMASDRVQAKLVQDEIAALRVEIDRLQEKVQGLVIVSPVQGTFMVPFAQDLPGQYIHQGMVLGYVVNDANAVARVVVTQEDQDRITQRLDGIELRLIAALDEVLQGRLLRSVPQASHQLPSAVLSVEGGGQFVPDSEGVTALSTRERLFEYEVELPLSVAQAKIGTRVYVRFDHGQETVWDQLSRRVRQLFLSRLNV